MDQTRVRRKKNRWVSLGAWALVLLALPTSLSWILGGASMLFDLVAAMQAQIVVLLLTLGLLMLCLRRWLAGTVMLVFVVIAAYPVVIGRSITLPSIQYDGKPSGVLRVVSCNLRPENEHWELAMETLMELDADLIIVQEIPPDLSRGVRRRGWLDGRAYPWFDIRPAVPDVVSQGLILSRHPLERVRAGLSEDHERHLLYTRVKHPSGEFMAGLFHPRSPRSDAHWRAGNEAVKTQLSAISALNPDRLVIGADLNSAPAQLRARMVRAAGLRISKPLMRLGGSYPAGTGVPDILTIEIDGVWTRGVRVVAWDRISVLGSDHKAIVMDFRLGASSPGS